MDDLLIRFLLSGGMDSTALLALFVVAAAYFLAPCAGYAATHRGLLMASMWVLLGRFAVAALRVTVVFFEGLEAKASRGGKLLGDETVVVAFTLVEMFLLILALVLFVTGLASLRRNEEDLAHLMRRPPSED
jgi:hypothetical protein